MAKVPNDLSCLLTQPLDFIMRQFLTRAKLDRVGCTCMTECQGHAVYSIDGIGSVACDNCYHLTADLPFPSMTSIVARRLSAEWRSSILSVVRLNDFGSQWLSMIWAPIVRYEFCYSEVQQSDVQVTWAAADKSSFTLFFTVSAKSSSRLFKASPLHTL